MVTPASRPEFRPKHIGENFVNTRKVRHKHLSAFVGRLYIVDQNKIIRLHFFILQQNIRAKPLIITSRNQRRRLCGKHGSNNRQFIGFVHKNM